jgi:hypothetical protein
MKKLIQRISGAIPSDAPKPWVIGVLLWIGAAVLMPLAFLLSYLDWMDAYRVVLAAMWALLVAFLGCVAWFLVEFSIGRKTSWR